LEDVVERWDLLEQPAPLVDAAHSFHEERLGGAGDPLLGADGAEVDLELALVPEEQAVDGRFRPELAELRIDELPVAEHHTPALRAVAELEHARLAADLHRLEEIDQPHVGERAREARLGDRVAPRQPLALLALQGEVDARDDLFDVDGLDEVVLDAQL